MIVSDLPTEIASTDAAFVSAGTPKSFRDITFEPYSLMRQLVASEVCGDNPHPITAVIVHMWVCTKKPDEVMAMRTTRSLALADALRWAEQSGITHPGTPAMDELITVYRQINEELHASTQVMQQDNGHEPKNVGGLPG